MSVGAATAFFSYSRDDSEFALRLAEDLKSAGASVWLDQLDIKAGEEWDRSIEDALTRASRMLLILSPSSVRSRNVRNEISFALDEEKSIVPILYRDCTVPLQLQRVQYIDFRTDYAQGLKALLRSLSVEHSIGQIGSASADAPKEGQAHASDAESSSTPQIRHAEAKRASGVSRGWQDLGRATSVAHRPGGGAGEGCR